MKGFIPARDGTKLYYEVRGDGPPLILCTGIAVSFTNWKYLSKDLAKRYRVIQWNYRGHGKSERPADFSCTGIADLADDLEQVRKYFGIRRFALLGHSMGVQVIFEYYRHHPQRVKALIAALGTYEKPFNHMFHFPPLQLAYPLLYWLGTNEHPVIKAKWDFMHRNPMNIYTHALQFFGVLDRARCKADDFSSYFEHFGELDMKTMFEIARSAQSHSVKDMLMSVDVPTLVIGGEKDVLTPPRFSKQMAFCIPKGEYVEIAGGSHAAFIEQPKIINGHIQAFLGKTMKGQ
jgi:pimeloyl-ACP methyl ester carboxylesterase